MSISEQLESLLNTKNHYTVAFDNENVYSSQQLQHHVKNCINNLAPLDHDSFLLFSDNSYDFAVNFLALIYLNRNIVITANNKPDWLDSIKSSYDCIISDSAINDLPTTHFIEASNEDTKVLATQNYSQKITFYTSGSSDKPKAIEKQLSQLLLEVETLECCFGSETKNSTYLATVSHQHIYGLIFKLLWPLIYKRTFYANIVLYPEQLVDLGRLNKAIALISSPAFLSRQDHELTTLSLQACFSSGSPLSELSAKATSKQFGIYPIEVFGSTETGGIGYRTQKDNNSTWTFFPGISIKYQQGKTLLTSPYLSREHDLDDEVQLLKNNQFNLLGRKDRIVKIEEKRVSLNSIESALIETPWISEAKVIVLQRHRTFIAAAVQLSTEGQQYLARHSKYQLSQKLKFKLKDKFEAVAIPRKWRYLEHLPYNSQGKLPVTTLMELFE